MKIKYGDMNYAEFGEKLGVDESPFSMSQQNVIRRYLQERLRLTEIAELDGESERVVELVELTRVELEKEGAIPQSEPSPPVSLCRSCKHGFFCDYIDERGRDGSVGECRESAAMGNIINKIGKNCSFYMNKDCLEDE